VDDIFCIKFEAGGNYSIAGFASADSSAAAEKFCACSSMNSAVNTFTAHKAGVCCVYDSVNFHIDDVTFNNGKIGHFRIVPFFLSKLSINIAVNVGVDIKRVDRSSLHALLFRTFDDEVFDCFCIFDVFKNKLAVGDVACFADNGGDSEDPLQKGNGKDCILDFIHITIVFNSGKKAGIDGNLFFGNGVLCKSKRETEEEPAFFLNECHKKHHPFYHIITSFG
jgi:hypothetical protein